jgi:hypothetical protein
VINRSGLTTGGGDDGSLVVNRSGVALQNRDGSGQVTDGTAVVQVNADGSGQITNDETVVLVHADGSGQYTAEHPEGQGQSRRAAVEPAGRDRHPGHLTGRWPRRAGGRLRWQDR